MKAKVGERVLQKECNVYPTGRVFALDGDDFGFTGPSEDTAFRDFVEQASRDAPD
jgi:hypothetical protein